MSESRSGARDVSCQLLSEYPMSEVRQYGSVKAERGTYPVYALFNFLEETSDAYGGQVRHRIPPIFSLELGRSQYCLIAARSAIAPESPVGKVRVFFKYLDYLAISQYINYAANKSKVRQQSLIISVKGLGRAYA